MNSIVCIVIYNLDLTVSILIIFLLFFSGDLSITHDSIQQKNINKLLIEIRSKQNPEKLIFNFSKVSLTDAEKPLSVKGLSFALSPKQLSYSDYLINFELFYRSTDNLKILSGGNLGFIKTRIKDSTLMSFRKYNVNVLQ